MSNKEIASILKLTASLSEVNGENEFKVKSYSVAAYYIEKHDLPLKNMSLSELSQIQGVGKSMASKIEQIINEHTFADLAILQKTIPAGVAKMLDVKGIGPKKVRILWQELNILDLDALYIACIDNKVAQIKGFGDKIQEEIIEDIEFKKSVQGYHHYADAEHISHELETLLKQQVSPHTQLMGDVARCLDVIQNIQYAAIISDINVQLQKIDTLHILQKNEQTSGPYLWRGTIKNTDMPVEIKFYTHKSWFQNLYMHNCAPTHLSQSIQEIPIRKLIANSEYTTENEFYKSQNISYIPAMWREGKDEILLATSNNLPTVVTDTDLKGILHNHTTYSDGNHTLTQMAEYCKELGYQYLGISDHSKTATYANGLSEERVILQHSEIDALNKKLYPFKIFKGIESDILQDGSLDYDTDLLRAFDFIVASIHSGLKMDEEKATTRLIKAIENPYTTILGHPTGRLLLQRKGYPINHAKIIDACAANGVMIEINADPWRLDIGWEWLRNAIEKNVMICINPDAHDMNGYHNMHYGVVAAQKGMLTKSHVFNALTLVEVEKYFVSRKMKIGK
ncbi:MAG: PHP domain-containing protein [Cytophagales bacterium]|nr:PHP domain-containing protein [Cytophagales bacterium]